MNQKFKLDVVMPGYLFCDLIFQGLPHLPVLGEEVYSKSLHVNVGGVFNSAIVMVELGMSIGIIADLGNDLFSDFIRNELYKANVSTEFIVNHNKPMPFLTSVLSFPEDRAFVTYMAESDVIDSFQADIFDRCQITHLHLPGLKEAFHSLGLIQEAKKHGATISMDCQWHPELMNHPDFMNILAKVDIFLPNDKEALYLTNEESLISALRFFQEQIPSTVIKVGQKGCIGYDKIGVYEVSALNVEVIDTTGAGDSFNAGFLYAFLNGLSFKESMAYGNVCGGLSVTKIGGGTMIPSIEYLQEKANTLLCC